MIMKIVKSSAATAGVVATTVLIIILIITMPSTGILELSSTAALFL
jgi:hypothetical protein